MKLYDYWRSSAAYRTRIALNLKGVSYDLWEVHLIKGGGAQKTADYRAKNPQGLVPALELDNGVVLSQSLAIIEYLEETFPTPPLLPADAVGRAQVRAMAAHIACDIHPLNNLRVMNYLKGPLGHDQAAVDAWYRHWIAEGFSALETQAKSYGGSFLYGEEPTLADICLAPQMFNARRFNCDLTPYPTLVEIDGRCQRIDAFSRAHPDRQPGATA